MYLKVGILVHNMSQEMEPSLFVKFFGNAPIVKVLDFLIENRIFDYSKTEIARESGIGWSTLHGIWTELEKNKIVSKTRTIGRAEMYRLNTENPLVKKFIELDRTFSRNYSDGIILKKKVPA